MIHRILILNASQAAAANQWLRRHPTLNPIGDDYVTVRLALLGDPDDASIVRAYACGAWLTPNQWLTLSGYLSDRGWLINDPSPATDGAHYLSSQYTFEQALADTTRKPFALKTVPTNDL
jgi:hypothetical protein